MGSAIAAHLANSGIQVLLLDIVPQALTTAEIARGLTLKDQQVRNRIGMRALQKLINQKPAPFTSKRNLEFIEVGNLEDDLGKLSGVDWIIEAVVENLAVKQQVLKKIDQYRRPGCITSTNTSGISVAALAEGRSADFQKHFLGAHFFNPPRYLKLLELIPGPSTAPWVLTLMKKIAEEVLGKGVVLAKDTPNFIANRIGTYGLLVTVKEMLQGGYSVGEVDSLTGTLIGRPKSATFRTLDVVGLDTFIHVAGNVHGQVAGEEKEAFAIPEFMQKMLANGWLGSKTGKGFFFKQGKEILELDPITMTYRPGKKLTTPAVERAGGVKDRARKLQLLLFANDRAGRLLWNITSPVLRYAAGLLGTIADDIVAIDRGMKWGFGWELGTFEMWDALGLEKTLQKMQELGEEVPAWILEMHMKGFSHFYKEEEGRLYYYDRGTYKLVDVHPKVIQLNLLKKQQGIMKGNDGASLIDLGDGVALLEFHSPHNAIGLDILQMIDSAIDEIEVNYLGLVIGNQGKHFCVGANLAMLLLEAQDGNLYEIEYIIRRFQQVMMRIKYCSKPVVAAPFGMTLGGGAEVCLAAAQIQASSETYIGLVESGVGLIPGGGGNKELYLKHLEGLPKGVEADLVKVVNKVFETIALAKVSASAEEARESNFLTSRDSISANSDHLLFDAKQAVLALQAQGYRPKIRKKVPVAGEPGYAALLLASRAMYLSGFITEYDLKIAGKLAFVLAGGKVPYGTMVDEQYLLDLEREAFLSLVSEPKTLERMQHLLTKGKPLRN